MKQNKAWLILIPVVVLAIVMMAVGGYMLLSNASDEYAEQISLAVQYIEDKDYDSAIAAFQNAIEIDNSRIDAYEGLARIYAARKDSGKLQEIIRLYEENNDNDKTLQQQHSDELQVLQEEEKQTELERLRIEEAAELEEQQNNLVTSLSAPSTEVHLDDALLSFLSGATFSEYTKQYGEGDLDTSSGTTVITYQMAPMTCTYAPEDGVMKVDDAGKPFSDSRPSSISLADLSFMLVGMTGETSLEVLEAAVDHVALQDGSLSFESNGCTVTIACDENGTISGTDAWNSIVIEEIAIDSDTCALDGTVVDATTGSGVFEAKMKFRAGVGNTNGPVEEELVSDRSGHYLVDLAPGEYTVEIEAADYITEFFEVSIHSWFAYDTQNFTISPELDSDEIRIVLEWGSFPNDLDSYLFGTSSDGQNVRVCYENMNMPGVASLDTDCMTGYGPETITLYDMQGSYEFVVADFNTTGRMAQSGATVKIYLPGETQPILVTITSSAVDDWFVCRIDAGQVTVVNTAYNGSRTPASKD